jgi:hypothetical protein
MISIRHQDDPSPHEIAEKCREIQARWSDQERMQRMRFDYRAIHCLPEPTSQEDRDADRMPQLRAIG